MFACRCSLNKQSTLSAVLEAASAGIASKWRRRPLAEPKQVDRVSWSSIFRNQNKETFSSVQIIMKKGRAPPFQHLLEHIAHRQISPNPHVTNVDVDNRSRQTHSSFIIDFCLVQRRVKLSFERDCHPSDDIQKFNKRS